MSDDRPGEFITDPEHEFLGHPKGLYVCFATELWERFSFYGMKFLLLLYLTKYHLFTDSMGLDVLGAYAGLVYALPVIGGLLADRYLGFRKAVVFGGILLSLGHILMAVEGTQATTLADGTVVRDEGALNVFYLALALIVAGVGYLKPNISTIVGRLYPKHDARRDSGFTIFYMGINIGSFTATLLCGWLGETYGWKYGFGAAGIGMIIGLITFLWGQKYLMGHAEPSEPERLKKSALGPINVEWAIYLLSIVSLGVIWWLVQSVAVVHTAQNSLLIVAIVSLILYAMMHQVGAFEDKTAVGLAVATAVLGLVWAFTDIDIWLGLMLLGLVVFVTYGFMRHNSNEYGQTVVLMVLIVSSIVFWALFEQSAASMTLYADRVVDRDVGGITFTAAQFGSLNAGFIMLLAIPFAAMWVWLAKRNLEPSTPVKFALGIMQAGLGFGALVLGAQFPDEAGKVGAIWLVLAYLLHTTGELMLSPVGLSAVTKLSIGRVVGVSMGTWFLATALSETLATQLSKLAHIETVGGEATDVAAALNAYTGLFEFLMWLGLGVGAFMLIISPLLRKAMHDVH
ncbi:MAG: peptide MFS transporter [Xanthomonadales bacterium]|nr:peptide MFS transporter [Xanthomonadales bacterium]